MNVITLHKTFNKQSQGYITTGNVISNTQLSSYIRPFHYTGDDQYFGTVPDGELQQFDLDTFKGKLNYAILEELQELTRENGGIAYIFQHWIGEKRFIHGIILTTNDNKLIRVWRLQNSYKSQDIIDKAIQAVSKGENA